LAEKAGLERAVRDAVTGQDAPSPEDVAAFITALRRLAPSTLASQDTARALVLLASPRLDHQDVGYNFFSGGEVEAEERRYWGIRSRPKTPKVTGLP